jgi:UDPglucose 6-dehydrogenase
MKITIFGTGYVGLVTGACLADVGHDVMCVDVDTAKIKALRQGQIPIYENGLEPVVIHNMESGNLKFTHNVQDGIEFSDVIIIAVGTPPREDGSADLTHVLRVADSIGQHMNRTKFIISKSTVPVGTCDQIAAALDAALDKRGVSLAYHVISNPEFLKEGNAVADFMKPDRIIVGCSSEAARELMRELYAPFNRNHDRMIFMDLRSSELTKYVANAMLATKISFINEMANIAESVGADIEMVRKGIGSDPRIGYHFIYPGCGYGGSCFPKDVRALARSAQEVGYPATVLLAVQAANELQKHRLGNKVRQHFGPELNGRVFALWGLAFKPGTDDMREASSITLLQDLWEAGACIQAYDPAAMESAQELFGTRDNLKLMGTKESALHGADALIICTEWKNFRAPDFDQMKKLLRHPVIFDGRNLYEPEVMKRRGFTYYAIGRGENAAANLHR